MDNPFSAPAAKPSISQEKSTPPPLDDVEPAEIQPMPESVLPPVRPEAELPPIKDEQPLQFPLEEELTEDFLPKKDEPLPEAEPELATAEVIIDAPEYTESKFDLEEDDADPATFSLKPIPEKVAKPTPKPISRPQESETMVASHHQPTAFAAPEGWSDADFDAHDGSELPELTMEEKSCRMCKYFHFEDGPRSEVRFGECRRSAPVGVGKAVWPSVLWESWCGEWHMGVGQEEIMQMARSVADAVSFKG